MFNKTYGIPTTSIRPFNINSPRQDPANPYSGVISKFIDNVSKGMPPVIFGDGSSTRDFVSVHDVVDMLMLMLQNDKAIGHAFNCGTGVPARIDELAWEIIGLYGNKELKPVLAPERPGDINYSYADISKAKNILGYSPKISLTEGLKELIGAKNSQKPD